MKKLIFDTLDSSKLIDDLITEMGLNSEAPEKVKELKKQMEQQLTHRVFRIVSLNLEPAVVDEILYKYQNETDSAVIFKALIENSEASKKAIREDLAAFYEETMEAFRDFS